MAVLPRLGILAARNKPEAETLEREITTWIERRGGTVRDEATMLRDGADDLDALIVLGGDGLMMRSARMFPNLPLLGINFGHVGFLTMVERSQWRQALPSRSTADAAHDAKRSGARRSSQKPGPSQWGWVKWCRATTGSMPRRWHASRIARYRSKASSSSRPGDGSQRAHSTESRNESPPAAAARSSTGS